MYFYVSIDRNVKFKYKYGAWGQMVEVNEDRDILIFCCFTITKEDYNEED